MGTRQEAIRNLRERQARLRERMRQGIAPDSPEMRRQYPMTPHKQEQIEYPRYVSDHAVEEEHEDMGMWDRFVVKNLSQSQAASVKYLEMKYPQLEFTYDGSRIYLRTKGDKSKFKVMDPSTGLISTDIAGDMLDVVADVVQGVMSAIAAVSGALAGAAVGGPKGAVAGGIAAAGGMDMGTEYIRQGMGKSAGLPQDPSLVDAAISGAAGATGTALFGSGAPVKDIIKSGMKKGVKELTKKGLPRMARGGLAELGMVGAKKKVGGALGIKAMSKAAEQMTGIKGEKFVNYVNRPEEMAEIKAKTSAGYAEEKLKAAHQKLLDQYKGLSDRYNELGRPGEEVDISKTMDKLRGEIKTLEKRIYNLGKDYKPRQSTMERAAKIEKQYLEGSRPTAKDAKWYAQHKEKVGDVAKEKRQGSKKIAQEQLKGLKEIEERAFKKDIYQGKTPEGQDIFDSVSEEATVPYERAREIKDEINTATANWKAGAKEGDKAAQSKIKKARELSNDIEKSIHESIEGAEQLRDDYMNHKNKLEWFEDKFKNKKGDIVRKTKSDQKEYFSEKGKRMLKKIGAEDVDDPNFTRNAQMIDEEYGTDLVRAGENLAAQDVEKAGWFPKSGGGTTSTSRTNLPLSGVDDGPLGRLLNTIVGGTIGSPAAWREGMKAGKKVSDKAAKALTPDPTKALIKRRSGQKAIMEMLEPSESVAQPQLDDYGNIIYTDKKGNVIRKVRNVPPIDIKGRHY